MEKLREKFEEYFEEATGWERSVHPDQYYVEDMWFAFREGAAVAKGIDDD